MTLTKSKAMHIEQKLESGRRRSFLLFAVKDGVCRRDLSVEEGPAGLLTTSSHTDVCSRRYSSGGRASVGLQCKDVLQ